jgi:hypothetical protein
VLAAQPGDFMLGLSAWVLFIALIVLREVVAIRIRRPILRRWVDEQGLTLISVHYRFRLIQPYQYFRVLVPFAIEVEDKTGHVTIGLAWVAGFIRRRVWVDWGRVDRIHAM